MFHLTPIGNIDHFSEQYSPLTVSNRVIFSLSEFLCIVHVTFIFISGNISLQLFSSILFLETLIFLYNSFVKV